jgi:hypothetical protein
MSRGRASPRSTRTFSSAGTPIAGEYLSLRTPRARSRLSAARIAGRRLPIFCCNVACAGGHSPRSTIRFSVLRISAGIARRERHTPWSPGTCLRKPPHPADSPAAARRLNDCRALQAPRRWRHPSQASPGISRSPSQRGRRWKSAPDGDANGYVSANIFVIFSRQIRLASSAFSEYCSPPGLSTRSFSSLFVGRQWVSRER